MRKGEEMSKHKQLVENLISQFVMVSCVENVVTIENFIDLFVSYRTILI